jgi:hypothetical protein
MAPSRSPTPRGGLAWYSETKTKLHLFLGARRGRHPLGQFNSPIVPEAVDGKPRSRGPPRPGGEVVTAVAGGSKVEEFGLAALIERILNPDCRRA